MELSRKRVIALAVTVLMIAAAGAEAGRILEADVYRDKLHGMWLGQILGNVAGRVGVVVATGGGVVEHEQVRTLLRRGFVAWLDASPGAPRHGYPARYRGRESGW